MSKADPAHSASIVESMELLAERAGDVSGRILERYFENCPEAAQLMDHMDSYMLGRMIDQVLLLIMESDDAELESYLRFETASHHSYGVQSHMYAKLFDAVLNVASDGIPGDLGLYWQLWMQDAGAPAGWAATNGLESTTP